MTDQILEIRNKDIHATFLLPLSARTYSISDPTRFDRISIFLSDINESINLKRDYLKIMVNNFLDYDVKTFNGGAEIDRKYFGYPIFDGHDFRFVDIDLACFDNYNEVFPLDPEEELS